MGEMETHQSIALEIPDILLPRRGIDLAKWAVIACDQFTSQPEYWDQVKAFVGNAPSTLNLVFPEAFLGKPGEEERIRAIRAAMQDYLDRGLFEEHRGFVYVERQVGRQTRRGLIACLDLEQYDYNRGATSLIRASEGTILDRIPPRVKIRDGAPLELPHIMVLVDNPDDSVIGPLSDRRSNLRKLYDFDLMMDSGRLTGYGVGEKRLEQGIIKALEELAEPAAFCRKYGLPAGTAVLLFAMGDGNHSLATAKTIWEKTKRASAAGREAAASALRYALVELVNLHDPALVFEPIHRVLFGLEPRRNLLEEWGRFSQGRLSVQKLASLEKMKSAVDGQRGLPHKIGLVGEDGFHLAEASASGSNLPVGTLQTFLDAFLKNKGAREVDYVHGMEPVLELGRKPGHMAFYLPAMDKRDLFKTVILDGVLPRKTFSMGEAKEKRFYMEARKLS
jgi:uncharacterized protein (DUF1015 family)